MERISANARRLSLINSGKHYAIETEILAHEVGNFVIVNATLKIDGTIINFHKLKYAESKFDDSYISWAETMAVAKCIAFALKDEADTVHTHDEFMELISRKTHELQEHILSGGDAQKWVAAQSDPDVRDAMQVIAKAHISNQALSAATKAINEADEKFFD